MQERSLPRDGDVLRYRVDEAQRDVGDLEARQRTTESRLGRIEERLDFVVKLAWVQIGAIFSVLAALAIAIASGQVRF